MARKEFTYDASHPAYQELQAEADALHITFQQRIHLLIVGRRSSCALFDIIC